MSDEGSFEARMVGGAALSMAMGLRALAEGLGDDIPSGVGRQIDHVYLTLVELVRACRDADVGPDDAEGEE